jgi:hypothetical protein
LIVSIHTHNTTPSDLDTNGDEKDWATEKVDNLKNKSKKIKTGTDANMSMYTK